MDSTYSFTEFQIGADVPADDWAPAHTSKDWRLTREGALRLQQLCEYGFGWPTYARAVTTRVA